MKTKKILSTLMAIAMIFSMLGVVAAVNVSADEYQLVWSDEFDGEYTTAHLILKVNVLLLMKTEIQCRQVKFQSTPQM